MNKSNSAKRNGSSMGKWLAAVIVLVLLTAGVGAGAYYINGLVGGSPLDQTPTFVVERGPLTISVTESGQIRSRERVVLTNEIEGRTTIISMIEEGTHVQPGDLLVELDSSGLMDQRVDQEIRVENAEAAWVRARENLEVTRNQAEADIARAKLDYDFAKMDLEKYIEGEYLKQVTESQRRISLAEQDLEQAQDRIEGSQRLFERQFISRSELKQDELSLNRAVLDLELARADLQLLQTYTHPRRLAELESDVEQRRMALERVERRANADVVQAEADLRARVSELNRNRDRLEKIEDQISKARVVAPRAGMVVYATTGGSRWSSAEPLQEGSEVRERQELIHLPSSSRMMAEVNIHESMLDKVRVGQPARIRVDALPGRTFTGRVGRIAVMPAQQSWYNPDLKVYATEIHIDEEAVGLRTGMNCRVEILVDYFDDTLYVPVQTVLRQGPQPTVWVWERDRFVPRVVEIGLDNNRMVQVRSGLQPGEIVNLTPPLHESIVPDEAPPAAAQAQAQNATTNGTATTDNGEEAATTTSDTTSANGPTTDAGRSRTASQIRTQAVAMSTGRSAGVNQWDNDTIAQARRAMETAPDPTAQSSLSEEDQRLIQMLTMMRQHDALDRLPLEEAQREKVTQLLAQIDEGQTPQIDDELRQVFNQMRQQMRQRRPEGGGGGGGGGEARPNREGRGDGEGTRQRPGRARE